MNTRRTAAFFDLDKTIIATSSAAAFSRPFLAQGLMNRRSVLRSAYAHFLYMIAGADEDQTERMRAYLSDLVAGWDVAQVSAIVGETLNQFIDPYVYSEAVELIAEHHAAGRDVVIVSASGAELVEPIAAAIGADHAIATRMEIADGRYTGKIDFYCYGDNKALAIRQLAQNQGYDLERSYAYSDSSTDLPMLEEVGFAYAVNPDRTLRRVAESRGWGVLNFVRPVSLWHQLPVSRGTATALTASAASAILALVAWRIVRRIRRRGGR
ncbi:HAD-IB family hydrolase [Rarobacter faecitabidus]|uniref:HAD superfamily hydrolase (TIGR01490 family) n=1 Tax=Rarobacter faecitabidus TaxID=13243 RepID=A0A542ZTE3_RARFA|nr:HAD-IB family hydrolase [Rarobacter faecitabidus]TQL63611.1 HAD superfamily hydrolase (TIGR01490 family) [Rarobacter faecitabidus]